jgi:hypothetical protein
MRPITFSIANAFLKLRTNDLNPIVEFIQAERTESLELMAKTVDEWQWRKAQGRAQFAEELLKLVEESPALAAKLNASR